MKANPFLLAPMAGITDAAFRTICARQGAGATYSEMVSAKALVYQDKKTASLMQIDKAHRPCGIQLFGSEPDTCAKAALLAMEYSKPDFIDINMGCPVPKIVNNGEGSALMRKPELAEQIIKSVKNAVTVPVTVKFRSGYDAQHINAPDFARMAEAAGADAICVHGRTRTQMYSGASDRNVISDVRRAIKIPLIASGDAFSAEQCQEIMEQTGANAVMIARGALGNPLIFADCRAILNGEPKPQHTVAELTDIMLAHCTLMCENKGEHRAMLEFRKHGLWYLNRIVAAKKLKLQMAQATTKDAVAAICDIIIEEGYRLK